MCWRRQSRRRLKILSLATRRSDENCRWYESAVRLRCMFGGWIGRVVISIGLGVLALGCSGARRVGVDDASRAKMNTLYSSDERVAIMGRSALLPNNSVRIGYPGVTARVAFEGTSVSLDVHASTDASRLGVTVDAGDERMIRLKAGEQRVVLAQYLPAGAHVVSVVHRTETWQGIIELGRFTLDDGGHFLARPPERQRRLLVIGDSVTCGEAIARTPDCKKNPDWWDPSASYGALAARSLNADVHLVCYGGRGLIRDWQGRRDVLNAPQFFELAVPDPAAPIAWDSSRYTPDVIVVSLGTNDFNLAIGPLPTSDEYVPPYIAFVRTLRQHHPHAIVLLTEGAIVNDQADPNRPQKTVLRGYLAEVERALGDANVHRIDSTFHPGDACDAHPTREQHQEMASELASEVRRIAGW